MLKAAILGAGPAGLFALDALLRRAPSITVDVYERLPTPFGLIRSGVAPDHQGTKAVVRQFERAFGKPGVRLLANVEVGRDVSLPEITAHYDLVFAATGAPQDRRLGVPGETLPGVYGSLAFTAWLNGHPDHRDLAPRVGQHVVIIGAGNVAIDVARLLAKTEAELAASDLCDHARCILGAAQRITLVARAELANARFDVAELRALTTLAGARLVLAAADRPQLAALPAGSALRECFATDDGAGRDGVVIEAAFRLTPVGFAGGDAVRAVRLREANGTEHDLACDTVITAIGASPPEQAWPAGVHALGWASGAAGAIPDSRRQAGAVVAAALAGLQPMTSRGPDPTASLTGQAVDWPGWKRIDFAETSRATSPRPRVKITSRDALLSTARG